MLLPSEDSLTAFKRSHLDQILVKGEELDIKLVNFVKDVLIPYSGNSSPELQWKLVKVLDMGCVNHYRTFHSNEVSLANTLSTVCLNGLFELGKSSEPS